MQENSSVVKKQRTSCVSADMLKKGRYVGETLSLIYYSFLQKRTGLGLLFYDNTCILLRAGFLY